MKKGKSSLIVSVIISVTSILLAAFSLMISFRTLEEERRVSQISNNYAMLGIAHNLIAETPSLLELHNISIMDLEEIGVTEYEVLYVMQSIHAAQAYYEVENKEEINHLSFTPYRKNFLRNPKVKVIWQNIMKDKLISDSPLSHAIDAFYEIEKQEIEKLKDNL